jgi:hypothetical protein
MMVENTSASIQKQRRTPSSSFGYRRSVDDKDEAYDHFYKSKW